MEISSLLKLTWFLNKIVVIFYKKQHKFKT